MPKSLQFGKMSWRRKLVNHIATAAGALAAVLVIAPLLAVFAYLVVRGIGSLNWAFLTQAPAPVGETGGGMGNAIAGSAMILAIASAIGIPLGIGSGIFVAEYARGPFPKYVRFVADLLNGVPSVVIGLSVYTVVVMRWKFSALAGGIALGIMMIPTITRSTEEMLVMVPQSIREAAYGLGIPRWRAMLSITLRTALPGVITGIMLAFARVAGETAPLMFTAFGNQFWNWKITQPTAALPLQIYVYANSPYDEWHRLAWAGALVLIVLIVGTVSIVRLISRRGVFQGAQ
jgi:phosphate ABC transporter, permease protein PstA